MLVIIGLIVGGVLVGQDLIRAAQVRAQISQIEQYNAAVNTFRDKYGGLPGDLNASAASQFGFQPRGAIPGEGDGNGVIQGVNGNGSDTVDGSYEGRGETGTFWADLGSAHFVPGANLISGQFWGYETGTSGYTITATTANSISDILPAAKIGAGNYVYVWSGGVTGNDGTNYYGLSAITSIPFDYAPTSATTLTVQQAFSIDKKVDDGFPQTGNVLAIYLNKAISGTGAVWAAGGGVAGTSDTSATPGSATTCYDNGNVGGATQQYSVEISNGAGANCALSFRFQ